MIFREVCRFLRSSYLTSVLASIVLLAGFSGAAITLNMIRALVRPQGAGLQNRSYATIAEQAPDGGLARIPWYTVEHLRNALLLPGSGMVAYAPPSRYPLQWQGYTAQISIAFTQAEFFSKFTDPLYAGHNFTPEADSNVDGGQAIISEEFARHFFGGSGSALHQNLKIRGRNFQIIGIAPKGFGGLWFPTDLWTTPRQWDKLNDATSRAGATISPDVWKYIEHWYFLVEASPEMGSAPVQTLAGQLRNDKNRSLHLEAVETLTNDPVRNHSAQASSRLGFIVAVALLLAASLNYCILLVARSSRSAEEFRLKYVLGANSVRLVIDASIGPLFVVLTGFSLSGVVTVLVQHQLKIREGDPVIAAALGSASALKMLAMEFPLACLLGASIALVPVISLVRKSGAPRTGFTTTHTKLAGLVLNGIVVIEITVCTLVCLFAGAFVREYYLLSKVDIGFDPKRLTSYEANLIKGSEPIIIRTSSGKDSPIEAFVRLSMLEAHEQLPGLQSITAASCTPFGPPMKTVDVYRFQSGTEPLKATSFCAVSLGFFSTMRMSFYEGSGFTDADFEGNVNHVVISQSLAKALWPQQNAGPRMIRLDMPGSNLTLDASVVGVVNDIRQDGASSSTQPTVYVPLTGNASIMSFPMYFLTRGTLSSEKIRDIVYRESQKTVKHLGIVQSYSIEEKMEASWQKQNIRLKLALFGALLVTAIAYLGLYGVLIHSVSARQKELALRLAFGASRWDLQRVVIEKICFCCLTAICLALLVWKTCLGIFDPQSMAGASWSWEASSITALLCVIVSIAISVIPARRATRISPITLLKDQ